MKRNNLIIIGIAALIALWMFSKSGNASTEFYDGVYSNQIKSDTAIFFRS